LKKGFCSSYRLKARAKELAVRLSAAAKTGDPAREKELAEFAEEREREVKALMDEYQNNRKKTP
jgi:hypothetical protein